MRINLDDLSPEIRRRIEKQIAIEDGGKYLRNKKKENPHTKAKVVVDPKTGDNVASGAQMARLTQLREMEKDGKIQCLHHESVIFRLGRDDRGRIVKYTPDFVYIDGGQLVAEDYKGRRFRDFGPRTALFKEKFPEYELRVTNKRDLRR